MADLEWKIYANIGSKNNETNKRRGTPRMTWNDVLAEILRTKGKTWTEAKNMTRNRNKRKQFTKS